MNLNVTLSPVLDYTKLRGNVSTLISQGTNTYRNLYSSSLWYEGVW